MNIMDRGDEMNKQSKSFVDMSLNQIQDEAVRDVFGRKKTINLQEKNDDGYWIVGDKLAKHLDSQE